MSVIKLICIIGISTVCNDPYAFYAQDLILACSYLESSEDDFIIIYCIELVKFVNHVFVCIMRMNIFIKTRRCMIMILIQICT